MQGRPSHLRVDVTFENPVVFSGEKLSAIITFRNIAPANNPVESGHPRRPSAANRNVSNSYDNGSIGTASNSVRETGRRNSNSDAQWSGRRVSMQIMNTFRDIYTQSSTDVSNTSAPISSVTRSSTVSRSSRIPSQTRLQHSECLLMGFAQLQGFFRVDKTIVDPQAFDHIKKQGVVVGTHGLEYGGSHANDGGFLKGLASGIGDFLSVGLEPDANSSATAAEPRRVGFNDDSMGSDDLPIFSTPQSLLFVDLDLAPGQAKSFSYQITLPKPLPPSFRGKAFRINYNLVIGAQRLSASADPVPRIIFFPFRVFPHVDENGKQYVHDFEQPIVLKSDIAIVTAVNERRGSSRNFESLNRKKLLVQNTSSLKLTKDDFRQYVLNLMDPNTELSREESENNASYALMRKRSAVSMAREAEITGDGDLEFSARENIDFIAKYNYSQMSLKTNFDVAKKGKLVATVSLSRPVYRVGEEIVITIDFERSRQYFTCHHITATLETTETIEEDILTIPKEQAEQQTSRIFSQQSLSSFSTTRSHLELTIPPTTSPQFSTSVLSYSWFIKLDFVITALENSPDLNSSGVRQNVPLDPLLSAEAAAPHDDKGQFFIAKKVLPCETVACRIPLHVLPTNQDIGALIDHSLHSRRWTF